MKIINGKSGTGKTEELFDYFLEKRKDFPEMIFVTKDPKKLIMKGTFGMDIIPFILSYQDVMELCMDNKLAQTSLVIDDLDNFVQAFFNWFGYGTVKGCSITTNN